MLHRAGSIQMPEYDAFGKPTNLTMDQLNEKDVKYQMKQNSLPEIEEELERAEEELEAPKEFQVTKEMIKKIKFRAEQGKDHNGELLWYMDTDGRQFPADAWHQKIQLSSRPPGIDQITWANIKNPQEKNGLDLASLSRRTSHNETPWMGRSSGKRKEKIRGTKNNGQCDGISFQQGNHCVQRD